LGPKRCGLGIWFALGFSLHDNTLTMLSRCGLTTPQATDTVKGSNGIAPWLSRTHYLSGSGENVLYAPANSTHNLALLVPHSSAITFGSAIHLPITSIRARSLATDSIAEGFTHAFSVRH
jgi:hypothetical protein